jgi:hypothetical protein
MFGVVSGTAADYHELNAGAHRKPPKVLSAPSLVWHLAFWTNFTEQDERGTPLENAAGSPRKKDAKQIRVAVDRCIIALRNAIAAKLEKETSAGQADPGFDGKVSGGAASDAGVQLTPCVSGAYLLFGNAYREVQNGGREISFETIADLPPGSRQKDIFESTARTVTLRFSWRELDVSIRFEVHTEYFSISTFVELDKKRLKGSDHIVYSSFPELNAGIARILKYLKQADPDSEPTDKTQSADGGETTQGSMDAHPSPAPGGMLQSVQVSDSDETVARINRYCFHEFWKTYQLEILSGQTLSDLGNEAIFQHIFADFRAFVASDRAVEFPDPGFFEDGKPAIWGRNAKKKLLPLIQHRQRSEHTRYECAVNYMLDGRALYLSTLGPQLPSTPEDERIPVEFIVYAHQRFNDTTIVNKLQLGRLVSQILLLGTLRLCALKDVKALHYAGGQLGLLEQSTQKARDAIALTEAAANSAKTNPDGDPLGDRSAPNDATVMNLIATAHKKLNEITGKFLQTGTGLSYRIEILREAVRRERETAADRAPGR